MLREGRFMQRILLRLSLPFIALAVALAACNYGPNQVAAVSSNPGDAAQDSPGRSLQIRVSSTHRTYSCQGNGVDSVQVTGSVDILTITGNCGSLQVTGNSNSIVIDSVLSVQVTGASNSVLYRSNHRPTVNDDGQSNSIAHATGQTAASDGRAAVSTGNSAVVQPDGNISANGSTGLVSSAVQAANAASEAAAATAGAVQGVQTNGNVLNIILSRQRTTQDCGAGKIVNINGYQNDITLTGSCQKVTLNGWGNTIRIEEVAAIEVTGHTNVLTWERGRNIRRPAVQIDIGTDNTVRHLTPGGE